MSKKDAQCKHEFGRMTLFIVISADWEGGDQDSSGNGASIGDKYSLSAWNVQNKRKKIVCNTIFSLF